MNYWNSKLPNAVKTAAQNVDKTKLKIVYSLHDLAWSTKNLKYEEDVEHQFNSIYLPREYGTHKNATIFKITSLFWKLLIVCFHSLMKTPLLAVSYFIINNNHCRNRDIRKRWSNKMIMPKMEWSLWNQQCWFKYLTVNEHWMCSLGLGRIAQQYRHWRIYWMIRMTAYTSKEGHSMPSSLTTWRLLVCSTGASCSWNWNNWQAQTTQWLQELDMY